MMDDDDDGGQGGRSHTLTYLACTLQARRCAGGKLTYAIPPCTL